MKVAGSPDPRDEPEVQRDDPNLADLLQELRMAGLGVQVPSGTVTGGTSGPASRPRPSGDVSAQAADVSLLRKCRGGHA